MTATVLTRAVIENALVAWIAAASPASRQVIGWPGAPRPTLPYFTIKIMAVVPYGQDDKGPLDANGVQTIMGDRFLTASLQAFGAGALDLIRGLSNSLSKDSIVDTLLAAGLAPGLPGKVDDLTQMLETDAEERAHVDVQFGVKDVFTDAPGLIEHVTGSGTVVADTGTSFTLAFSADV